MKVLITGVTGFIGSSLAKYFTDFGYEVIGVGRNLAGLDDYLIDSKIFKSVSIDLLTSNLDLLDNLEKLEPFGNGNDEPKFIIKGLKIDYCKVLKEKHLLIFFKSKFGIKIKAISFNSIGTKLGENLMHNKSAKFEFGCKIKRDNFSDDLKPQLIIKDAMIIN